MKISTLKFSKRAILMMAPFVFMACEKPNDQIGLNQVIGSQAGLKDTSLTVISYTQNVDSLRVTLTYDDQVLLGGYTGNRLAGAYVDPYFGRAEASFVSQMVQSKVNTDFGTNPMVDSVRLYLRYAGSYGDTSKSINLEVHELANGLSRDTSYYSNYTPMLGEKLGERTFVPKPNTPVSIGGKETTPTLAIPLQEAFFQQNFLDVGDGAFTAFSSDEEFIDYFKGILVKTTRIDGSILYFNLSSTNSSLNIYYHNDEEDSLDFSLTFSQQKTTLPIGFNLFEQNYSGFPTGFDFPSEDQVNGEQSTYVQAMGGVATIIEVKGIQSLQEKGFLVNRAVLEVPKQSGTGSALAPPSRLEIREFGTDGPGSSIPDFNLGTSSGDGAFRSEEFHQGRYVFDITRYIFDVINGGENQKLAVIPSTRSTAANRVILKGGNTNDQGLQLKIYYTKP